MRVIPAVFFFPGASARTAGCFTDIGAHHSPENLPDELTANAMAAQPMLTVVPMKMRADPAAFCRATGHPRAAKRLACGCRRGWRRGAADETVRQLWACALLRLKTRHGLLRSRASPRGSCRGQPLPPARRPSPGFGRPDDWPAAT